MKEEISAVGEKIRNNCLHGSESLSYHMVEGKSVRNAGSGPNVAVKNPQLEISSVT